MTSQQASISLSLQLKIRRFFEHCPFIERVFFSERSIQLQIWYLSCREFPAGSGRFYGRFLDDAEADIPSESARIVATIDRDNLVNEQTKNSNHE